MNMPDFITVFINILIAIALLIIAARIALYFENKHKRNSRSPHK